MRRYQDLLKELDHLQSQMTSLVDKQWELRRAYNKARQAGHSSLAFLPRRLSALQKQTQLHYDTLVDHLNHLVSTQMNQNLFLLTSQDDVTTFRHIRAKMRYLINSFGSDLPPISHTLNKINQLLAVHG